MVGRSPRVYCLSAFDIVGITLVMFVLGRFVFIFYVLLWLYW
uniref:Transmembrane protein n=1 Tax=Anguilla anguilla TaxID=7936 RepID=A0A0E9VLY9_ANGAN